MVQGSVLAPLLEKFFVCAEFANGLWVPRKRIRRRYSERELCDAYPFLHHGDLVGATGSGKPVCDEYDGLYALSLFRGGYSTDGLEDLVEMNERDVVSHFVVVTPKTKELAIHT